MQNNHIKLITCVLFILLSQFAIGQHTTVKSIISGQLIGIPVNDQELYIEYNDIFTGKSYKYKPKVQADGSFHQLVRCSKKQEVSIYYNKTFKVILQPKDSIYVKITQKGKEINCLFKGDGKELNEELNLYLSNYYAKVTSKEKLDDAYRDKSYSEIARFAKKLNAKISKQQMLFKQEVQCSEDMKIWLDAQLKYNYCSVLFNYPFNHMRLNKLRRGEWSVPAEYYSFVKEMPDISEQYYLHSELMTELIRGFSSYSTYAFTQKYGSNGVTLEMGNPEYLYMDIMLECMADHPNIRQLVLGDHMHRKLSKNNVALYAELKTQLKENISDPIILEGLNSHYQSLTNGKVHSSVQLSKMKGATYHQIIKEIVDKHPTQLIYVDLWATWCAPCIKAMKKAPSIHKKYAGEDISFVYLCLGSKEPDWNVVISKHHLHGNHYWLNSEQSGVVVNKLETRLLPRYLVINNGEVVDAKEFSFSPSNPKTFELIDELLKKE
ncbi:TlpA family protein disulfide reductase [Labilibacter marinus]|uniref:TlpA family protein disulfide reductase n=1 Tax=Labilibacter marinus TaxID=1477105 RepID=UPI00082A20E1|nr:thioredoxin-like domain-containing protein [Labilibacter marinus]